MQDEKKLMISLKKEFSDLPDEAYIHLQTIIDEWFKLSRLLFGKAPSSDKANAFVAQMKSGLHICMMEK